MLAIVSYKKYLAGTLTVMSMAAASPTVRLASERLVVDGLAFALQVSNCFVTSRIDLIEQNIAL